MERPHAASLFLTASLLLTPGLARSADSGSLSKTRLQITSRDGTVLAAMAITPDEPVAGMVLLPGSGPAERHDLEPLARELAARGIATLAFDKRGCGESAGSWVEASLEDLADDALAAARTLRQATDLEGRKIGLWGHSQGVWVATVAAARSEQIGFLIGVSGGGLSPREVETHQYRMKLEHAGVSPADTSRALALVDRYFTYLESGQGREAIARELDGGGPWAAALELARVLVSEKNRRHWSWVATFDPRRFASDLRLPVLLVFGEQDHLLPLEGTVAAWTESLARARNPDFSVKIYPAAGHDIRIGGSHHGAGGSWATGYLDLLGEWAGARGGSPD